jgi:hypothetical protein
VEESARPMRKRMGEEREKRVREAAAPILKGSVAWSRGGGWLGVAPCGEEVGERRGRRVSTTVRRQWPKAGGSWRCGVRAWLGQSGATTTDRRAPTTARGSVGRELVADVWAPAIVQAAGSASFE